MARPHHGVLHMETQVPIDAESTGWQRLARVSTMPLLDEWRICHALVSLSHTLVQHAVKCGFGHWRGRTFSEIRRNYRA